AYQSSKSGKAEIYIHPFPGSEGAVRVSTAGGVQARWRPDGRELFYVAPDGQFMSVRILEASQTLKVDPPAPLFATHLWGGAQSAYHEYSVSPDGRQFLMNVEQPEATTLTLILNWKPKP